MRPHELADRLPGERIRQRLPSVWKPAEAADEQTPPEDPEVETSDAAAEADGDEGDGGSRLRTVLLGVSVGSGLLAVGAAVAARLLGRGADGEEPPAEDLPTPREREEGTAAMVGLGFALVVEAIRRRFASPTN